LRRTGTAIRDPGLAINSLINIEGVFMYPKIMAVYDIQKYLKEIERSLKDVEELRKKFDVTPGLTQDNGPAVPADSLSKEYIFTPGGAFILRDRDDEELEGKLRGMDLSRLIISSKIH
jgi:hypothetical protein